MRGVDYWTESDIAAVETDVIAAVGQDMSGILGLDADFEDNTFTRIGEAAGKTAGADFDVYPMYGGRRRCCVANDGVILAYRGDSAYTETGSLSQAVTIGGTEYPVGTPVQVMVYQPKFYYRVQPLRREPIEGGEGFHLRRARYMISDLPREGFALHPAFCRNGLPRDYILLSAYEGCLWDADGNDGAGEYILDNSPVMNTSSDQLSSIAGAKPISGQSQSLNRANARTLAHNRGNGWELQTIASVSCSQLLMAIEYASFNTQASIGPGVNGLAYSTESLAVNTGGTSALGDASGSAPGETNQVSVSYRGEENLWGNLHRYIDGVNPYRSSDPDQCEIYIADHDFADSTGSGSYANAGFTPAKTGGYISAFGYSEDYDWLFLPSECLGDATQPVGDSYYVNNTSAWKTVSLGGRWFAGAIAGAFCWDIGSAASNSRYDGGARLAYFPPEASGEDTGWIQPKAYLNTFYRRIGKRVSVRLGAGSGAYMGNDSAASVCTLPEGYRPSGNLYFVGYSKYNDEELPVVFQVNAASGLVSVKKAPWSTAAVATHQVQYCEFSFFID